MEHKSAVALAWGIAIAGLFVGAGLLGSMFVWHSERGYVWPQNRVLLDSNSGEMWLYNRDNETLEKIEIEKE